MATEESKWRKEFADRLRAEGIDTDTKVKIVVVNYTQKFQSAWIVPADIDPENLYVKWDKIHYGDKEINFQKVLSAVDTVEYTEFKHPDEEPKIYNFNDADMIENEVYYDCCDGYDEDILEKVKAEIASLE